jgi:hypothetical protein
MEMTYPIAISLDGENTRTTIDQGKCQGPGTGTEVNDEFVWLNRQRVHELIDDAPISQEVLTEASTTFVSLGPMLLWSRLCFAPRGHGTSL